MWVYVCMSLMLYVMSVGVCLQEKTYSGANEVAKLEKLMKFVRQVDLMMHGFSAGASFKPHIPMASNHASCHHRISMLSPVFPAISTVRWCLI